MFFKIHEEVFIKAKIAKGLAFFYKSNIYVFRQTSKSPPVDYSAINIKGFS